MTTMAHVTMIGFNGDPDLGIDKRIFIAVIISNIRGVGPLWWYALSECSCYALN